MSDGPKCAACQQPLGSADRATELFKLLEFDRTGLASALVKVRGVAAGFSWIARGEWGSYDQEDRSEEALRLEVGNCLEEIEALSIQALKESGDRAVAGAQPDTIASLRAQLARSEEQREQLAKDLAEAQQSIESLSQRCETQSRILSMQAVKTASMAGAPHWWGLYTNHAGETRPRLLIPIGFWHGKTEQHPEPQYLVECIDVEDRGKVKDFALLGFRGPALLPAPETLDSDDQVPVHGPANQK